MTFQDLVIRAKELITEIDAAGAATLLEGDPRPTLVDVREPDEHASGAIPGSALIPLGELGARIEEAAADPSEEIVLYCAVGSRSAVGALQLQQAGYQRVSSLAGGIVAWRDLGLPIEIPESPGDAWRVRYARHLVLPGVGVEGQKALGAARVLLLGAGGLGSPAAYYLAAAGVGTLGIVDDDVVDMSNLQRQILHGDSRIGDRKVDSAADALSDLNPEVEVVKHPERLAADNALEIMSGYDLVVDGADNFPTRYLVNDASLHLRIPVVHGSVFRWEGQATVFVPYEGPCYRCLFPVPPPPELAPNCEVAGVLGVLPGVIGSVQALEAAKLILGIGDGLVGRLLTYDSLSQEFTTLNFARDPECPACGDERQPPVLVDYDPACVPAGTVARPG